MPILVPTYATVSIMVATGNRLLSITACIVLEQCTQWSRLSIKGAYTMHRHGKNGRHQPPSPERGLESKINRDCVIQILRASLDQDIKNLLLEIGFKMPAAQSSEPNYRPATDTEAKRFLQSEAGRQSLHNRVEQQLRDAAEAFPRSPEGKIRLNELQSIVLAEVAFQDSDFRDHLFRNMIQAKADSYIQSPRGQERLRQLLADAVRDNLKSFDVAARASWTTRNVEEILNDLSSSVSKAETSARQNIQ